MEEINPGFTQILSQAKSGDRGAEEQVWEAIYEELKRLAHHQLRSGWRGGTIETTGLVHELYLKLGDQKAWTMKDRGHFMALSCKAMRHILVQNVRQKGAQKRGGDQFAVTLKDEAHGGSSSMDLIALDEALETLKDVNPRLVQVVELRLFGGFSLAEIAKIQDVSSRTTERDWMKAKMYLYQKLT